MFVSNNKSSTDGLKWAHLFMETIPEEGKSSKDSYKRHSRISTNSKQSEDDGPKIVLPDKVDINVI